MNSWQNQYWIDNSDHKHEWKPTLFEGIDKCKNCKATRTKYFDNFYHEERERFSSCSYEDKAIVYAVMTNKNKEVKFPLSSKKGERVGQIKALVSNLN